VKATAQREMQGGTLKEVERDVENGVTVYEVEYVLGGVEYELDIAENGALLSRKAD
jgi:uncharacterized membrane protein YkoI